MDALEIDKAVVAGVDWGARTARYQFYFALRGGRGPVERSSQDGVRAAREQGRVAGETDDDAEAASLQAR